MVETTRLTGEEKVPEVWQVWPPGRSISVESNSTDGGLEATATPEVKGMGRIARTQWFRGVEC